MTMFMQQRHANLWRNSYGFFVPVRLAHWKFRMSVFGVKDRLSSLTSSGRACEVQ